MLQPRRRRLPLTSLDNGASATQKREGETKTSGKVKRRRKRRRRDGAKFRRRVVCYAVLSAAFVASLWRIRRDSLPSLGIRSSLSLTRSLRARLWPSASLTHEYHLKHRDLYNAVRQTANSTREDNPAYEKNHFTLTSTYGTQVTEQGCNLTVIFMDPRLASAGPGDSAWFSLESVAAFFSDACVLLQTGKWL